MVADRVDGGRGYGWWRIVSMVADPMDLVADRVDGGASTLVVPANW